MTDDDGMTWGYRPPTAKGFGVATPDDAANQPGVPTTTSRPTPQPTQEPTRAPAHEPASKGYADPNPVRIPTPSRPVAPMPMTRPRRARSSASVTPDSVRKMLTNKAVWVFPIAMVSLMVIATRSQNEPQPTFPTFDLVDLTFGSLPPPEFPVSTAAPATAPTTASNSTHLALGEHRDVESFAITVVDFVPDATNLVADANFLNEPAPAGHRYVMVSVEAENQTLVEATWWVELLVEVRDGTGATYPSFQGPVAPDPLSFDPIQPGAVDVGNLVFTVPDDAVGLEFVVRPGFGLDEIVWQLTP